MTSEQSTGVPIQSQPVARRTVGQVASFSLFAPLFCVIWEAAFSSISLSLLWFDHDDGLFWSFGSIVFGWVLYPYLLIFSTSMALAFRKAGLSWWTLVIWMAVFALAATLPFIRIILDPMPCPLENCPGKGTALGINQLLAGATAGLILAWWYLSPKAADRGSEQTVATKEQGNRPVILFTLLVPGVAIIWNGVFGSLVYAAIGKDGALALLGLSVAGFGVLFIVLIPVAFLIAFSFRNARHSILALVVWEALFLVSAFLPLQILATSTGRVADGPIVYSTQAASGLIVGAAFYWLYVISWDPQKDHETSGEAVPDRRLKRG